MAIFWRSCAVVLSAGLLAAHFSRAGATALAILSLGVPLLLLIRKPWAARTVQLVLILAGFEWLRTLWSIAARRMEAGQPWLRMAAILGGVALLTWATALVFRSPRMRAIWFAEEAEPAA